MPSKAPLIKSKTGNLFAIPLRYGGFLVIVVGLVIAASATLATTIMAVFFVLIGLSFATASTGIILNPNTKSIKHYTSILGYKKGHFRALDDYPFVAIIQKNKGSGGEKRTVYEVHMLSKSHRGKTLVLLNPSAKAANAAMNNIAKVFNLEITKYGEPMGVKKAPPVKTEVAK